MRNLSLAIAATLLSTSAVLAQQPGSTTKQPGMGQMDHSKMSPAEHARMGQQGQTMGQMDHSKMRVTAANPFPPAEMKMHQQMMHAVGTDAAETWVRKMIEHHRGAVEMTKILQSKGGEREALAKAQKSAAHQESEIVELQGWLKRHGKKPQ